MQTETKLPDHVLEFPRLDWTKALAVVPERPFALKQPPALPGQPFARLGRILTLDEMALIRHFKSDAFNSPWSGTVSYFRELLITRTGMDPVKLRSLTADEWLATLGAIRQGAFAPVPNVGQVSVRDFPKKYPDLSDEERERLRKRLERWRGRGDYEKLCKREVDQGTGREEWFYPLAVVDELAEKVRQSRLCP